MRGLDTVVAYARAEIAELCGYDQNDEIIFLLDDAKALGLRDFADRNHNRPPALFSTIPALIDAWWNGWDFGENIAEMSNCPSCTDASGNPCPSHG